MVRPLAFFLVLLLSNSANAETLRAKPVGTLLPGGEPMVIAMDELVEIALPEASPLNSHLILTLELPREASQFRQIIGLSLYSNLRPRFRMNFRDYLANRVRTEILPVTRQFEIRIPLHAGVRLLGTRDAMNVDQLFPPSEGNPAIVLIPLEKEIPEGLIDLRFTLRSRVEPGRKGAVRVSIPLLNPVELESIIIQANDVQLKYAPVLFLDRGDYTFNLVSSILKFSTVRLRVVAGQEVELTFTPSETESYLVWNLPQGVRVNLNGKEVVLPTANNQTNVAPGTYEIRISIGDFQTTRVVEISRPGNFNISLDMEIRIDGD